MFFPRQLGVAALARPLSAHQQTFNCLSRVTIRASSLSAIHRGVRSSDRVQYGDNASRTSTTPRRRPDSSGGRSSGGRSTRRPLLAEAPRDDFDRKFNARQGDEPKVRSWRQQQKLRKKLAKKTREKEEDKRREEAGEGRITRRKRFTMPELTFAKDSMVYRLKHGDLKDTAEQLQIKEPVKAENFRSRRREEMLGFNEEDAMPKKDTQPQDGSRARDDGPRDDRRPRNFDRSRDDAPRRDFGRSKDDARPRDFGRSRDDARSKDFGRSRDDARPRDFGRSRDDTGPRNFGRSRDDGPPRERSFNGPRDDRPQRSSEQRNTDDEFQTRGPRKEMMNMTIKYATAASQFLYGRSVVQAALEQGRRKLYRLYIYGGENRKDSKDNTLMTRLAQKHDIPITIVPNGEQRLMDKMSMGRPHNGFVLETSPLPQLPVKSLGKLEETPTRLGFHVDLDFQTKEDQAINGTDDFIPRVNDLTPRPFVLLLDEIMDPGNLGGILRTASYLGVDAVGITSRGSSTLTPVVLKSAAGAVEEISLFTVTDAVKFVEDSGKAGWKTYAAVAPPARKLRKMHGDKFVSTEEIEARSPLNEHPCLLVLGNEGYGLSKAMKIAADYEVSVPRFVTKSCVDSLNVSVAAGLLCHSFVKDARVGSSKPALTEEFDEGEVEEEVEEVKEEKTRDAIF